MTGSVPNPRDEVAKEAKFLHSEASGSVYSSDRQESDNDNSLFSDNVKSSKKNDVRKESRAGHM